MSANKHAPLQFIYRPSRLGLITQVGLYHAFRGSFEVSYLVSTIGGQCSNICRCWTTPQWSSDKLGRWCRNTDGRHCQSCSSSIYERTNEWMNEYFIYRHRYNTVKTVKRRTVSTGQKGSKIGPRKLFVNRTCDTGRLRHFTVYLTYVQRTARTNLH